MFRLHRLLHYYSLTVVVSKNKDIYESLTTQIVIHDDLGNESTKDYLHRLSKSKPKMFVGLSTKSLFIDVKSKHFSC